MELELSGSKASQPYPLGGLVRSLLGQTVGAAVGALIFVLFCVSIADRLVNPVSAAERTDFTITVTAP
jgi:hypothetical protein